MREVKLTKSTLTDLYDVYYYLDKATRENLGLMLQVPVFIQDPLVALENPVLGVQIISVRMEACLANGPTSSRIAVVDFNGDDQTLRDPIRWDEKDEWFHLPDDAGQDADKRLPDGEKIPGELKKGPEKYQDEYRDFITSVVKNPYFHQFNVWAVVQRILEFYEASHALGRSIPWGFDGNRLLIVPHAGYGENAYYDKYSKSLQFYYFGDEAEPGYTCLSHDIIAHETGHAILDGIRPLYYQLSTLQTGAFHEFIADLTAIMMSLFNNDIRRFVAEKTEGKMDEPNVLGQLAEEFGREVENRAYLRTAFNDLKMTDEEVKYSLSPHLVSQVMTGAMYEILSGIATKHIERGLAFKAALEAGEMVPTYHQLINPTTVPKAFWWAAERLRQIALQPLDLCPPCDIHFLDYAQAVIRNYMIINPEDRHGYLPLMLDVFHSRGLCLCKYESGKDLPEDCLFKAAMSEELDLKCYEIESVSRSRTAAYYFLNEHRKELFIPPDQDFVIADLYETKKLNVDIERLPREVVILYTWQEQVILKDDPKNRLKFGKWKNKAVLMTCGGTLVFDDRGNLKSWFHKPGTQHLTEEEAEDIRRRIASWKANPVNNMENRKKINQITKKQLSSLAVFDAGIERKREKLSYISTLIQRGLIGPPKTGSRLHDGDPSIMALESEGEVRFETMFNLRHADFEDKEETWPVNY